MRRKEHFVSGGRHHAWRLYLLTKVVGYWRYQGDHGWFVGGTGWCHGIPAGGWRATRPVGLFTPARIGHVPAQLVVVTVVVLTLTEVQQTPHVVFRPRASFYQLSTWITGKVPQKIMKYSFYNIFYRNRLCTYVQYASTTIKCARRNSLKYHII